VDPAATYRVTVNNFLAGGGDNFTVFKQGTNPLGGAVDVDSLVDYFGANSPIAPPPLDRVTRVP
jgi:5'-nucleotidase